VRRVVVSLAGLLGMAALALVGGVGTAGTAAAAAAAAGATLASGSPSVRTVLGPGVVAGPGGIALDTADNLFVADTGHCRILVVPARTGQLDGLHVRAGRAATLAGGACTGRGSIGHPSDVAVDGHGDLYIAEATAQRVQEVRAGSHAAVTVAGTGTGGFNGNGLAATASELGQPTGVAVDAAGDVYIADTANCRVRVLPAATTTLFGQPMTAGHLYTVAGTGVCGSAGQGGPTASAQLWDPVAVTLNAAGDLLVADSGDQSVLLAPVRGGSFYGSSVAAGDIGVVVGGSGGYGPYLADGLPANGSTAELNDPRGLAVGPTGALFVTDGFLHVIRVVPAVPETLFGRAMKAGDLYTVAGALPISTPEGDNDDTRWVLTQMGTPIGVAVSSGGALYYADGSADAVRAIPAGAGTT
jgi:trimeric autotransporter adhesin